LTEVMPQVERAYRIAAEPNSRAIAGLSIGGTESLLTGLNHRECFAWICAFTSGVFWKAPPEEDVLKGETSMTPKAVLLGDGTLRFILRKPTRARDIRTVSIVYGQFAHPAGSGLKR
jgi:enterochelin esterase-like enzyme